LRISGPASFLPDGAGERQEKRKIRGEKKGKGGVGILSISFADRRGGKGGEPRKRSRRRFALSCAVRGSGRRAGKRGEVKKKGGGGRKRGEGRLLLPILLFSSLFYRGEGGKVKFWGRKRKREGGREDTLPSFFNFVYLISIRQNAPECSKKRVKARREKEEEERGKGKERAAPDGDSVLPTSLATRMMGNEGGGREKLGRKERKERKNNGDVPAHAIC